MDNEALYVAERVKVPEINKERNLWVVKFKLSHKWYESWHLDRLKAGEFYDLICEQVRGEFRTLKSGEVKDPAQMEIMFQPEQKVK